MVTSFPKNLKSWPFLKNFSIDFRPPHANLRYPSYDWRSNVFIKYSFKQLKKKVKRETEKSWTRKIFTSERYLLFSGESLICVLEKKKCPWQQAKSWVVSFELDVSSDARIKYCRNLRDLRHKQVGAERAELLLTRRWNNIIATIHTFRHRHSQIQVFTFSHLKIDRCSILRLMGSMSQNQIEHRTTRYFVVSTDLVDGYLL